MFNSVSTRHYAAMTSPIAIEEPTDLLSSIPFLLGFHPENILIVLALTTEEPCGLRFMLQSSISVSDTKGTALSLIEHLQESECKNVVIACYGENIQTSPPLLVDVVDAVQSKDLHLVDALFVAEKRWRSLLCSDPSCCTSEGAKLPDLGSSRVGAEHIYRGFLLPPTSIDVDEVHLPEDLGRVAEMVLELWAVWLDKHSLSKSDAATLIKAVSHIKIRDFCLTLFEEDCPARSVDLWKYLLPLAPIGFRAPVATLLTATAYEAGEVAVARMALGQAFCDQPKYSLAQLLERAMNAGWPAQTFARMRLDLTDELRSILYDD